MLGIGLGIPEAAGLGDGQSSESLGINSITVDRASSRTGLALPADGEAGDALSVLSVTDDVPFFTDGRLSAADTWSAVDANGVALPGIALNVADAATNLILRSEEFDNAVWGKFSSGTGLSPVITPNDQIAPDGTMTADKVVFDKGAGILGSDTSRLQQVFTAPVSSAGSLFAKSLDGQTHTFNYSLGGAISAVVITPGEYTRLEFTQALSGLTTLRFELRGSNATTDLATIAIWGAQVEDGSAPTPYIPTTTATASRVADKASIPTPSVLTPEQGAIEFVVDPAKTGQSAFAMSSFVNAANYLSIGIVTTQLNIRKLNASVATQADFLYTHTKGVPVRVQAFWDTVQGFGIRAADSTDDISVVAFATDANTEDVQFAATMGIGNRDNATFFIGDYSLNQMKFYSSKTTAGWI